MSEVICPSIPGSLLWLSNHAPGMDIWDITGLVGTAASWPSCASWDWSPGSAGLCVVPLSSGRGSLVAAARLSLSNLSAMYSWGPPSASTRLRIVPAKPVLAAPSSEFGVAVPDWSLLKEGECSPCPRSGTDLSPTWQSPDGFLQWLKQQPHYCEWLSATTSPSDVWWALTRSRGIVRGWAWVLVSASCLWPCSGCASFSGAVGQPAPRTGFLIAPALESSAESRFLGCGCLVCESAHPCSPPETEDQKTAAIRSSPNWR